jgi:hypothetical protein
MSQKLPQWGRTRLWALRRKNQMLTILGATLSWRQIANALTDADYSSKVG